MGERVGVEVAGGLRDEAGRRAALAAGAARAVVGTAALEDPTFAGRLVAAHGAERIAVAIDVRRRRGRRSRLGAPRRQASTRPRRIGRLAGRRRHDLRGDRDRARRPARRPRPALYERMVALGRGAIIASAGIATLGRPAGGPRRSAAPARSSASALYEGRLDLAEAIAGYATSPTNAGDSRPRACAATLRPGAARPRPSVPGDVPAGRLDLLAVRLDHLLGDVPGHVLVVVERRGERAAALGQ